MDKSAVYEELKKNPKNVRFNRLCNTAEIFGFRFRGGKGSHRIYVRDGIIDKYNLLKEGNNV
jgi:hypothetical protein